jgi:uncharacterized protein (TIGR02145 family)
MKKAITMLMLFCAAVFAQNTFTDPRDKKTYKVVKIGTQTWMAQNLNYNANGSKCYGNDPANCAKYGRPYNWSTAKNACPKGWHLPSYDEWETLVDFAGGDKVAGKKLKAESSWNGDGNNTDEYGFSALPGGYGHSGGDFLYAGGSGFWWNSSEYSTSYAYYRYMYYYYEYAGWNYNYKYCLFSVRCLHD